MNKKSQGLFGALFFVGALSQAQAAMISYDLTYSNNATGHISGDAWSVTNDIPNGTTYATVTIDNDGIDAGVINFSVALSSYWDDKIDSGFGIQSFAFNLDGGAIGLADTNVSLLPTGWGANVDLAGTNQDGMGDFDVTINKSGQPNRQDPLTFSIGLDGDSLLDYVAGSQAGANGSFLFALHIAGFTDQNPSAPVDQAICDASSDPASIESCNLLTSVWVGNSAVVPVPAAAWLFGSGLLGLAGIARRKKS